MHALVVETEGFGDALALVVAGANADRVHTTPVALRLGMHLRIAIHLAGGSQQQPRPHPPRQTEHVVGAQETGLGGFDRIELIVNRRGRAGQMPDAIHLQPDGIGDVVADQLETGMADPVADVVLATGVVVVEADHLFAGLHQPIDQMGAQKASPTGDQVAVRHLQPSPTRQTVRPAARAASASAIARASNSQAGRRISAAIATQSSWR